MGEALGSTGEARGAVARPLAMPAAVAASRCFIAADVGGTNARLCVVHADADGAIQVLSWKRYPCGHYPNLSTIIAEFVASHPAREGIDCMVIATAGVVLDDEVINSNLPWRISLAALRHDLHLRELHVVNDFAAAAHGVSRLASTDSRLLTPGVDASGDGDGPTLVIGPGTGLGAAICIPSANGVSVLPTEAGMAAFAPGDERELEVLRWLWRRGQRHVCTEQLLSGQGLVNLYGALVDRLGVVAQCTTPAMVTMAARAGDPAALEAVQMFCGLLGSVIGDLAMIASAQRVYVAGGVVAQVLDFLPGSEFHSRLVDKGAMRAVLERVPVRLVENEKLGVLGAASWYLQHLEDRETREKAKQRRAAAI